LNTSVMPTLMGVGYGTYQQRPENFLLSFVTHTAALGLMFWLLHLTVPAKIIPPTTANSVELAPYVPQHVGKGGPSGGGGGDASKLKASAGTPPKAAKQQFTPPTVLPQQKSKLMIEPTVVADLKTDKGQAILQRELKQADVLLTSFRPSALRKLGLEWKTLHTLYPRLSMVAIFGALGARAEEPGHDLTYVAENDLVSGLELPATLYADMGGSLLVSEAVLQARLQQLQKGKSVRLEVALSDAAAYLGLPRAWGVTAPDAMVGGAHAGYRVYACKNGRVALAALEPHFAAALASAAGLADTSVANMLRPQTQAAIAAFVAGKTRKQLDALAVAKDIPLHTLQ